MKLTKEQKQELIGTIRDVKDFPKKGIIFKDFTTLLNNAKAFAMLIDHLKNRYKSYKIDFVVGAESRGFIFGAPLASALEVGFVPIRKHGKLPFETKSQKYSLEYGVNEVQIHTDAFKNKKNARVLFIDDLLATGGTARASAELIKQIGGNLVEACFIMELLFLSAKTKLELGCPIYSVLEI